MQVTRGKIGFDLFMVLVLAVFLVTSLTYGYLDRLLPLIISVPAFGVGLVCLWRDLRLSTTAASRGDEAETGQSNLKTFIPVLWIAGLGMGIWLLGFLWAVPLFVVSYLKQAGEKWLLSIGLAAVALLFMDLLFVHLLKVQLFTGVIWRLW